VRPAVHELITSEIKARAAAMEASRPRVDQVAKLLRSSSIGMYLAPKQRNGINGSSPVAEWGLPVGKAQTDAHELLESVLDLVSQVLENHVIVGEMMECHENSPQTTANGVGAWSSDTDMSHLEGSGYNLGFVLTVIQSECQLLICDILRATPDATSADAAAQTARLASKALPANAKKQYLRKTNEESHGESEEGLSFAFRFTDTILASPGQTDSLTADTLLHGLNRRKSPPGSQEGYGTAAVLSERGIYLTSAVYRPVLQFMDKITSLLPQKYTSLVDNNLQSFMENFVKNQFLPIVHVDYRTRVANALASPAAFRLKAYPGAVYETLVEKGRPILQGPMSANHLITEVLGWAQAMPMYASEILELVQTLLDRTLERCRAVYTEAVLGSLSSSIIGRVDMSYLMKQEPAHLLLDVSYLSQLEQKVVVDAPLDTEGLEVEMEMNNLLLSLRPIRQEQLISPNHKMVLLAALSDSLDYMSESVQQLGYNTSPGSPLKKKNAIHHVAVHHRRMNSALTAGLGVLTEKYHLLSAECLRTLRVELQLLAIYHLQGMAGRVYVSDQDAEEPEEFVVALTTQIARIDEEMAAYVPPLKRSYIFGGICSISAAAFIKALNEMQSINMLGVRQICRNCIALQQALVSVSPSSRDFVEERFDRVRTYFECLNLPFEALVAFVTEHDALFSFPEYSSLLKVSVPGRDIPSNAVQRLGRVLAP
jgi:exocyst complex component 4